MTFIVEMARSIWMTTVALAPSLFLGLLIAGVLHVFVKRERIFKHMGKPGIGSVLKASLIGVPLPLCSCGVLPAAISLRKDGASKGAVVSFLASTPQTGVDSIAPTWVLLGWPVALVKVVAAFLAGLISGSVVDMLEDNSSPNTASVSAADSEKGSIPGRIWRYAFGTLFRDIYQWLFIGIAVSALISVLIQPGELSEYPILGGPLGMLVALAVGIPLYVCSVSSIPIAAALVGAGFPAGSALVFLMAGPVTNAATMGAVRKELGRTSFLSYIITVIGISLLAGFLLNGIDIPAGTAIHHHGETGVLPGIAAAALFAGILYWSVRDVLRKLHRPVDSGLSGCIVYTVGDMKCGNCVRTVTDALLGVKGVLAADVSLENGAAVVYPGSGYSSELVLEALSRAGHPGEVASKNDGCGCGSCERN